MAIKVTMWKTKDGEIFPSEKDAVAADAKENLRSTLYDLLGYHYDNGDYESCVNLNEIVKMIIALKKELRVALNDEYQESLNFKEE